MNFHQLLTTDKNFIRVSYLFRILAYCAAAALILVHYKENALILSRLGYISLFLLMATPHLLFLGVKNKRQDIKTITLKHMMVDLFVAGWVVGLFNLSPFPSFICVFAVANNYIATRAFNKIHNLLLIPIAASICLYLQDFHIITTYGNTILIATMAYGLSHFLVLAYIFNFYARRFKKNQTQLLKQHTEIEKQHLEILKKAKELKVLNDSLKSLNSNLENNVLTRTEELEKKNNKLEEYAFINAHKLRAPVATILGLLQFFEMGKDCPTGDEELLIQKLALTGTELNKAVEGIKLKIQKEH